LRVALPCILVDRVAGGEHGTFLTGMARAVQCSLESNKFE
jgi:hypothetical protein